MPREKTLRQQLNEAYKTYVNYTGHNKITKSDRDVYSQTINNETGITLSNAIQYFKCKYIEVKFKNEAEICYQNSLNFQDIKAKDDLRKTIQSFEKKLQSLGKLTSKDKKRIKDALKSNNYIDLSKTANHYQKKVYAVQSPYKTSCNGKGVRKNENQNTQPSKCDK
tara:strand:+ start:194669 stop:195166 length:498 start_codon:yes stop_codon:yes gene_type:complete